MTILGGISQEQKSILHEDFDYKYLDLVEGTSARNTKRQRAFKDIIDHRNNPNKFIRERMEKFYAETNFKKLNIIRDTSMGQASKELERQQIKLLRLNR